MQVGTTKDQGLYNKPSSAVHPGPLAAGTLPQYNNGNIVTIVCGYMTQEYNIISWCSESA